MTIQISYDDPNHLWPFFSEELSKRLESKQAEPINPTISSPSNISGRTPKPFPLSNIQFRQYSPDIFERRDLLKLHQQYHAHISLIGCEEMETYKKSVVGRLSNWLEAIHSKRNQHSIIIQITTATSINEIIPHTRSTTPISRADLVLERLSADFSDYKNNRIVRLCLKNRQDESWVTTSSNISDIIYISFWNHIWSVEEDIRKMEAQKILPGWNFCTFFIQKESLALSLENSFLYEDSLIVYQELYDSFNDYTSNCEDQQGNLSKWMVDKTTLIFSLFSDPKSVLTIESTCILRSKILLSQADIASFLTYIFGSLFRLLRLARRPIEIISLTRNYLHFVSNSSSEFSTHKSWFYDLAIAIILDCDSIIGLVHKLEDQKRIKFLLNRGLLCLMARDYLWNSREKGRILFGDHGTQIDIDPTFNLRIDDSSFDLLTSDTKKYYFTLYSLTMAALEGALAVKNSKSSDLLRLEQSRLLMVCKQSEKSLAILLEVLTRFDDWPLIRIYLLRLISECQKSLNLITDAIKTILEAWRISEGLSLQNETGECISCFLELLNLSSSIEGTITVPLMFYFPFNEPQIQRPKGLEPWKASISINWKNKESVLLDRVSLNFTGDNSEAEFAAQNVNLHGSGTCYSLENRESSRLLFGSYTLSSFVVIIGPVIFKRGYLDQPKKILVDFTCNLTDISVKLNRPKTVFVDEPQLELLIDFGGYSISNGYVKVSTTVDKILSEDETCAIWKIQDISSLIKREKMNQLEIQLPKDCTGVLQALLNITSWKDMKCKFLITLFVTIVDYGDYRFHFNEEVDISFPWNFNCHDRLLSSDKILKQINVSFDDSDHHEEHVIKKSFFKTSDGQVLDCWTHPSNIRKGQLFQRNFLHREDRNQLISLVMELEDGNNIEYAIPNKPVPAKIKCQLKVEDTSSIRLLIGTVLKMSLMIKVSEPIDLRFELDYGSSCWYIGGKIKGILTFGEGGELFQQLDFLLIPIRSGSLAPPVVQLYSISGKDKFLVNYDYQPTILPIFLPTKTKETFILSPPKVYSTNDESVRSSRSSTHLL